MHWFYLAIAIVSEVAATSALKLSDGFARFLPSILVLAGYALAFYFLSLTLRTLPIAVAYAVWSGIGVALVSLIGSIVFEQTLGSFEIAGIGFIVFGVVLLNVFSHTAAR
jgi:small multidrug resistance pump